MVEAFKEFAFRLDDLSRNFDRQIMGKALSKGAGVFRRAIRKEIRRLPLSPEARRELSRGLYVKRHRRREGRPVTVSIRFRTRRPTPGELARDAEAKGADPWWWHLVEYGTADRTTRKGVARGAVKATPFVAPAIQKAEAEAFRVIQQTLNDELEKRLAEYGW